MLTKTRTDENGFKLTRHKVREGIQQMIVRGQCKPGEKLAQQSLAKKFGVGQGVVREALLELQVSGLVETFDNRGVFVGELNIETLLEAYRVREVHEGLAARLCCDRITRAEIRKLKEIVDKIYVCGNEGKLKEMGELDRIFHNEILKKSGNELLIRLVESYAILQKIVRGNRNPKPVEEEHIAILFAIENGNADEAERMMRQHIATGRKFVEEQIAKGAFVPEWVKNNGEQQQILK